MKVNMPNVTCVRAHRDLGVKGKDEVLPVSTPYDSLSIMHYSANAMGDWVDVSNKREGK